MTDRLLEWMSFRRTGRISDIAADLADAGAARRTVDDLATLGHLELLPGASWKIAPPVLAGLPRGPGSQALAVLYAARARQASSLRSLAHARKPGRSSQPRPQQRGRPLFK